jgi:hypothetical protein
MGRQIARLTAIVALLVGACIGRAQECVAPPAPVCHGCNTCHHHGFSLERLVSWMTYRPVRVPHACECRVCQLGPTPPLFMYFIGEYGPRSPSLGYPVWDHDLGFSGPEHCGH